MSNKIIILDILSQNCLEYGAYTNSKHYLSTQAVIQIASTIQDTINKMFFQSKLIRFGILDPSLPVVIFHDCDKSKKGIKWCFINFENTGFVRLINTPFKSNFPSISENKSSLIFQGTEENKYLLYDIYNNKFFPMQPIQTPHPSYRPLVTNDSKLLVFHQEQPLNGTYYIYTSSGDLVLTIPSPLKVKRGGHADLTISLSPDSSYLIRYNRFNSSFFEFCDFITGKLTRLNLPTSKRISEIKFTQSGDFFSVRVEDINSWYIFNRNNIVNENGKIFRIMKSPLKP